MEVLHLIPSLLILVVLIIIIVINVMIETNSNKLWRKLTFSKSFIYFFLASWLVGPFKRTFYTSLAQIHRSKILTVTSWQLTNSRVKGFYQEVIRDSRKTPFLFLFLQSMEDDLEDMEAVFDFGLQKLGYSKLQDGQKHVVEAYLTGKDVFFCSPTGSGKSLCFETASLFLRELQ